MKTTRVSEAPAAQARPWWTTVRRLGAIGPLAAAAAVLPAVGGIVLLVYAQSAGDWLRSHGEVGPILYTACFTILAGLALLPTYAQAIVGGFAFGATIGTAAALAGFVGAAVVGYLVAWLASGDKAEQVIAEHAKWKAVHDELLRGGFWKTLGIVTLIRVPPNSPFAMTNLVLAATKVPLPVYVIGTLVGMAPRTFAAVYIGSTFSDLNAIATPLWMKIGGIVLTLIVLGVIGLLANRAISHVTGIRPAGEAATESAS